MELVIHRGTREIGGSCVELRSQGSRLVLDIGTPLVNPDGSPFDEQRARRTVAEMLTDHVLPSIPGLYGDGPCSVVGVVLTHAHQDHYGLSRYVRPDVPLFASDGTEALIAVSRVFLPDPVELHNVVRLPKSHPIQIGPFSVTAHLVDHSAPDAVAVEVESEGARVFYSGDLRGHGRKAALFERMVRHPPENIDVLLMEGSTLGRDKPAYPDEFAVERAIVDLTKDKQNLALLFCSSQNLDRLVTAFKAAKTAGRMLVIDLYTAFVLDVLRRLSSSIPQYTWLGVRVKFWHHHVESLSRAGRQDFVDAVARSGHGIRTEEIVTRRAEILMLAKANTLLPKLLRRLPACDDLTMIWSMWEGYLAADRVVGPFCAEHNLPLERIHASGHARVEDLCRLAQAVQPRHLVPIHTFHPERYEQFGVPMLLPGDGEGLSIG